MLLLDYQNVLIESLLRERFAGCAMPRRKARAQDS
jgi:actin related protein 2/3 complex subunit 2